MWEIEKSYIEEKYNYIKFIWQIDNAEDEYKKVLGESKVAKHKLNRQAKEEIHKFINSPLWKRILGIIKEKEEELDAQIDSNT